MTALLLLDFSTERSYTIVSIAKKKQNSSSISREDKSLSDMERIEPQPAPDFELADSNGVMVRLSDYKGKVVVLVFNRGFA